MKKRWETFEEQVRDIASLLYNRPCNPERVSGNDIDGVVHMDEATCHLIEITVNCTLEKVRNDINKLVLARSALFSKGVLSKSLVIIDRDPTQAMIDGGKENNVAVLSHNELASHFFDYERYRFARSLYPFGSAIDPETGEIDKTSYIPVLYAERRSGKDFTPRMIAEGLAEGKNFIVLGEYGSGKSRCVAEVFSELAKEWGVTFLFPMAVNLRECWGLERGDEVIRRHLNKLGLDELAPAAIRTYNRKNLVLLLDGFDEVGTQSWSTDDARLRQLRAQALVAAKDLNINSGTGTLITGREHYFSSDKEMLASLGMNLASTIVLRVKEEFSLTQMLSYFQAKKIDVTLPDWLPRRPLICHTISQLDEIERDDMFGVGNNEAGFWNYFIEVICKRDARINASFDAATIYEVFLTLAAETRNKPGDVGPISQRELQEAFESVVGSLPVEDAAVMLQRLPSLGRVGPDTGDRQFIDTYILDGLRAHQVHRLVTGNEEEKRKASTTAWTNPLRSLGQKVLASKASGSKGGYLNLAKVSSSQKNRTLAGDIVTALMRMPGEIFDFQNLIVEDSSFSVIDFTQGSAKNLQIKSSTIEELIIAPSPPIAVQISDNLIAKIVGATSVAGLGDWVRSNDIEQFDSVKTTSRIRDAHLSTPHELLVTIVKKTFFQPGSGRKEEALLRGLSGNTLNKVAPRILNLLIRENVLSSFRGDEGTVYAPNRSSAGRMQKMLDELTSSSDPIWQQVGELA